jgi:hypothetical protein
MSDAQPTDVAARFEISSLARVKAGVVDPDEPKFPLGGWIGTVIDIVEQRGERMCLVEWSDETLARAHPIYDFLAEREGLDSGEIWLDERDLEPSAGPAVPLDSPSEDFVRAVYDRDARLRAVLGLAEDEPFPLGDELDQLEKWHAWLAARMPLPFEALMYDEEEERVRDVTVLGLIRPEEDDDFSTGLWCDCREENRPLELPLSELEVKNDQAAEDLVAAYRYWHGHFCNVEDDDEDWFDDLSSRDVSFDDMDAEGSGLEDDIDRRAWLAAQALLRTLESGESVVPPGLFEEGLSPGVDDETAASAPLVHSSAKVGRNDPCPCGSGLKFKKCCLKRSQ